MKAKNTFYVLLFYVLTHFLLLFYFGVLWDDQTIIGQSLAQLTKAFRDSGSNGGHPVATYIHWSIINNFANPVLAYRLFTFLIFGVISIIFFKILQYYNFHVETAVFITIIFGSLPFNFARSYVIIFPYTLGLLFMFCGLLFFCIHKNKGTLTYRILSVIFCFSSYYLLNSTLFILPFLMLLYLLVINTGKNKLKLILNNADNLVIVPLIYYLVKITLFKPVGNYVGYNVITTDRLITAPLLMLTSLKDSILYLPLYCFKLIFNSYQSFMIFVFFIFLSAGIIKLKSGLITQMNWLSKKQSLMLCFIGLILLIIGCYPYNLAGHIIFFEAPISRDQILLPIGFSILFYAAVSFTSLFINNSQLKSRFLFSAIILSISLFSATTFIQYVDAIKASFIEASLAKDLKKIKALENGNQVCLYSDDFNVPTWKQSIWFYSLCGISKNIFHHQN